MHFNPSYPRWIFIDLDDTLWDFSANSTDALLYLFRTTPFIKDSFSSADKFLEIYFYHNERLWNDYHHRRITSGFLKGERFRATLREVTDNPEIIEKGDALNEIYLDTLARGSKIINGAEPLLKELSKSFLIGIISNGFIDVQYKKLYGSVLAGYVQRMIVSDEIGINKPAPEIFRYAETETGAVPSETIMIGDNPDTDIAGAVNAGWKAVFFNRKGKALPENAELSRIRTAETLGEIPGLIRQLQQD